MILNKGVKLYCDAAETQIHSKKAQQWINALTKILVHVIGKIKKLSLNIDQ